MLPVILAFDAELPFVCSQEFTTGDRPFRAEEPCPWRDLGIDERTLHSMWRAGFVRCAPAVVAAQVAPSSKQRRK